MRTKILLLLFITVIALDSINSQTPSTDIYMITCSPGSETYSMYGHSALRLVDTESGIDQVYNWGVFDFSTPNFNYMFARGRLDYMLGVYSYNRFLQEYFQEERSVYIQKVNLNEDELIRLKMFLNENIKEENRFYRYDFFKDNCATRIRDIFETIFGDQLIYPFEDLSTAPTYRDRLNEYQQGMLWLDVGVDLLIGTSGDDKCGFSESMFLPDYLMENLSQASISKGETSIPLLGPVETVFEFDTVKPSGSIISKPWFILSVFALAMLLFTFMLENRVLQGIFDQLFFVILFVPAFLMIFTNYLTDHEAMRTNFNMIWLNPLLLFAPFTLFMKRPGKIFWRVNIALSVIFMILAIFIKQTINPAFIPIILMIIMRSYYRITVIKE